MHYLEKTVNGAPLRRPPWYFDVRVQGNGLADIPTHLVDQAQRLLASHGDPAERRLTLRAARLSATRVPRELFSRVTGLADFPDELGARDDALDYFSNGHLAFRSRGVDVEVATRWDLSTPPGGGDMHRAIIRGTRAIVRVEQGPETGHARRVIVEARGDGEALRRALHEPAVELAVTAERAFLRRLEGGCQVPIAACAELGDERGCRTLRLRGRVIALGGEQCVDGVHAGTSLTVEAADALGTGLAEELLGRGADALLAAARTSSAAEPVPEP